MHDQIMMLKTYLKMLKNGRIEPRLFTLYAAKLLEAIGRDDLAERLRRGEAGIAEVEDLVERYLMVRRLTAPA